MAKRITFMLILFVLPLFAVAQTTFNPSVQSSNNDAIITEVTITSTETIVKVRVPKSNQFGAWVRFNSAMVLVPCDAWDIQEARGVNLSLVDLHPKSGYDQLYLDEMSRIRVGRQNMSDKGWLIRGLGTDNFDVQYKTTQGDTYFELHFDKVPVGKECFFIRELDSNGGKEWCGIHINNPYPVVENLGYSEESIKSIIDEQNDGIVGVYQELTKEGNQYRLGCIKQDGSYKFVFLGCKKSMPHWEAGEVKAILHPTASPATFQLEWFMADKTTNSDCYVVFDGVIMKVFIDNNVKSYIKMYPTSSSSIGGSDVEIMEWTGTGFALLQNYIVTNYHVVENANSISIQGINGGFNTKYYAKVVATDKNSDLAVLQIQGATITDIPYSVKTTISDVGEDIFVLGYPLTSTMGDEIKLTTGVISSKTGFQGDLSLYQISAPVQPGNSGGPLFDSKGNVVGIVSSKHIGAENVGYAIKSSYLKNLIESVLSVNILPQNNTITNKNLSEKVKAVGKYVYYITCSKESPTR